MPENVKKLIQRYHHGAAAITVNSACVEVILFGGWNNRARIADTVVIKFGKNCGVVNFFKLIHSVRRCSESVLTYVRFDLIQAFIVMSKFELFGFI